MLFSKAQDEIVEDADSTTHVLGIGDEVSTPEGTGVVVDISLALADYDGDIQLEPPNIGVELEDGTIIHTCLCELELGEHTEIIQQEFERLWPPMDDVPEGAEMLIPEEEEAMSHTAGYEFHEKPILDDIEAVQQEIHDLEDRWESGRFPHDESYYYDKMDELQADLDALQKVLQHTKRRRPAAVSDTDRDSFFNDAWGKNILAALDVEEGLDAASTFFEKVWTATFNELDKLLEVVTKKDIGKLAKKVGFDLLQNMAGIAYFVSNEAIYDEFGLDFRGGDQVYRRWDNLARGLEKYLPKKVKQDFATVIAAMEPKLLSAAMNVVENDGEAFLDKIMPEAEEKAASRRKAMNHEAGYDTDESIAVELFDYMANEQAIYQHKIKDFYRNLATKIAQGRYDRDLAVKLFMHLVEQGAKKYGEAFATPDVLWHEMFPKDIRQMVATDLRDEFEEAVRNDEYNFQEMIPKKYRGQPLQLPEQRGASMKHKHAAGNLYVAIADEVIWGVGTSCEEATKDARTWLSEYSELTQDDPDSWVESKAGALTCVPCSKDLYDRAAREGGDNIPFEIINGKATLSREASVNTRRRVMKHAAGNLYVAIADEVIWGIGTSCKKATKDARRWLQEYAEGADPKSWGVIWEEGAEVVREERATEVQQYVESKVEALICVLCSKDLYDKVAREGGDNIPFEIINGKATLSREASVNTRRRL